ncbi:hypothetical protein Hamer_G019239 [Homarus americanus]|uniref:Uncharacterized protein n=1 Tax=Homarus americanus TaxID=6706 RepID=A0A8J5JK42_HOMAM|nr:hypothetical protein Hamer_G019239 [Homarus americanus]
MIRPLWPECVLQRDFEGFEELEEEAVVHEIVSLGNSMGLEVDDDVEKLVEEHNKELSTEELLELHKEENETLKRSLTSEESGEEEDKEESRIIPAKDLKDAFFCWSKLSKLAEDYHPDVGSVQKAISVFNDNVMNYFWKQMQNPNDPAYHKDSSRRAKNYLMLLTSAAVIKYIHLLLVILRRLERLSEQFQHRQTNVSVIMNEIQASVNLLNKYLTSSGRFWKVTLPYSKERR